MVFYTKKNQQLKVEQVVNMELNLQQVVNMEQNQQQVVNMEQNQQLLVARHIPLKAAVVDQLQKVLTNWQNAR